MLLLGAHDLVRGGLAHGLGDSRAGDTVLRGRDPIRDTLPGHLGGGHSLPAPSATARARSPRDPTGRGRSNPRLARAQPFLTGKFQARKTPSGDDELRQIPSCGTVNERAVQSASRQMSPAAGLPLSAAAGF